MKNSSTFFLLLFSIVLTHCAFAGPSVRVKGYVRKDGTYVQPHRRSAPDGRFYNNWSTKGNFNPYTGKAGKLVAPPGQSGNNRLHNYSPSLTSSAYAVPALSTSAALPTLENLPTLSESPSSLLAQYERDAKEHAAKRLRDLGVDANPETESLLSMMDKESRILAARQLGDLGHPVGWQTNSLLTMMDMESRIRTAKSLKDKGVDVEWQKHSLLQLLQMEIQTLQSR